MACITLLQNRKPGGDLEGYILLLVSSWSAASPFQKVDPEQCPKAQFIHTILFPSRIYLLKQLCVTALLLILSKKDQCFPWKSSSWFVLRQWKLPGEAASEITRENVESLLKKLLRVKV